MACTIFSMIGEQLRALRAERSWSQPALAARIGRDRARISELERDLAGNRWGRDRLTLFAEICDALDVVPVLVPKARAAEARQLVERTKSGSIHALPVRPIFDELFVDLGDAEGTA
ncbi:MAG TPA: helix-turn-helix transcriptional regulator [Allosphingosinicella sp.]|jgi:transcriptional regulator with XRE-family HTH domain